VLATLLIRQGNETFPPGREEFWVKKLPGKGRKGQTERTVGCKKLRPTPEMIDMVNLKQPINNQIGSLLCH
jgi:hypothetical protein